MIVTMPRRRGLGQQPHGAALGFNQRDSVPVEGHENLAIHPPALMSDNAIREVSA
jgi:hypothetical protein